MTNPILQALSGRQMAPQNNILGMISSLKSGNPDAMFNQMMNNNPQFRQFVQDNQGKSPEQIASEHGIDYNSLRQFL